MMLGCVRPAGGAAFAGDAEDVRPVINEFMASNNGFLADPQGQFDDWVELYNPGALPLDVAGMYLTDDAGVPTKWRIPDDVPNLTTIPARGYTVIWLDNDTADTGLHAPFGLDAGGEEIALFEADGVTQVDYVAFDGQAANVSFGRVPDAGAEWSLMLTPTPGAPNIAVVAEVRTSHTRGFYNAPFEVTLACDTPEVVILYTLDGSEPGVTAAGRLAGLPYTEPIPVARTTCLRARALRPAWQQSGVQTHTYIFHDQVIRQPANPPGFPPLWAGSTADYEMDPEVVNDAAYRDEVIPGLRSIRTMSIVMNPDDLFGSQHGIYSNATGRGDGWERPASIEILNPDGSTAYAGRCGIRIHSYSWRPHDRTKKHSFRLEFRGEYGPKKMDYKLFTDAPVDRFDSIVLRAQHGRSWPGQQYPDQAQYIRDAFARDTARDMGKIDGHATFVHLYLNGLYWGLYNPVERPDAQLAEEYFGGSDEDYDALNRRTTTNEAIDGDLVRYNAMLALADRGLAGPQAYAEMQRHVDVDNLIDFFLIHQYTTNRDGPEVYQSNNQRAIGSRVGDPMFRFFVWDMEYSIWNAADFLNVNVDVPTSASHVYAKLRENPEFRLRYADHVHRHMFNGGALTPEAAAARWETRASELYAAIVCESARWGDAWRFKPFTRNVEWMAERNRLLTQYFPQRTAILLEQLKSAGLYPRIEAPSYRVNGVYRHGGHIASSDRLSMQAPAGTIYYTTDGSDPRLPLAAGDAGAGATALVSNDTPRRAFVPQSDIGDMWRSRLRFNDASWVSGDRGVGYERDAEYEPLIGTDVEAQMYRVNTTCYIRILFDVRSDPREYDVMTLRVRYDDGFIAYLNGVEVARAMFAGTPQWDSRASGGHEAAGHDSFDVSAHIGLLQQDWNLLAIQGLNASSTSSDFLISVELLAGEAEIIGGQVLPVAATYAGPITLPASACIKSRVLSAGQWSALNEAVFAVAPVAEGLRISEIMYHPADTGHPDDPNTEYIELANVGPEPFNLRLVTFTAGIAFTFPDIVLAPEAYTLVVKDIAAFQARYGRGLPVAGQYTGALDNAGERVTLLDAAGQTIHDFEFRDDWYGSTDGGGHSLTLRDPHNVEPHSLDGRNAWQPSSEIGGSPGFGDPGRN